MWTNCIRKSWNKSKQLLCKRNKKSAIKCSHENYPDITTPADKNISFQDYKDRDIIRCEESKVNKTPSRERMWNNGKGAETCRNCNNITNAIKIGCLTRKQDRCPNSGLIEYKDFCRFLTFTQVQDVTGDAWTVDVIAHLFKGLNV